MTTSLRDQILSSCFNDDQEAQCSIGSFSLDKMMKRRKKNITGQERHSFRICRRRKTKQNRWFRSVRKRLISEDYRQKLGEVTNPSMFAIVLPWPNEFHVTDNDTIDICHA